MAKLHGIATLLFCLFATALARITPPENDDITTSLTEVTPKLRLPSDAVKSVPLTTISLHPINRRFPMRSKRPCRHHGNHVPIHYGNDMIVASGENSDFNGPEIIRGLDRRWIGVHRHHRHHHHHDREEESDSDSDSDSDDEEEGDKIKRGSYHRFNREKMTWQRLRKHFHHHRHHEEEKRGGFMNRVRDFIGGYF